jgi:hypothetical protein
MNLKQLAVTFIALDFAAFSAWTFYSAGGLFPWLEQLTSPAALQVSLDLVLMGGAFLVWMWRDARASGRNPWAWSLAVCATGSIAMLAYLVGTLSEPAIAAAPVAAK